VSLIEPNLYAPHFFFASFCDRDMMMRFRGGGVGHASTRDATNHFLTDRHPTDLQPHGPHQADSEEENVNTDEEMSEDPIPDLEGATLPSNDSDLADVEALAEVDNHEAEDDYGYNKGDSDDDEDDAEEREKQGLPEDGDEEDQVEQLGFARF
jgi:hypothetical protein